MENTDFNNEKEEKHTASSANAADSMNMTEPAEPEKPENAADRSNAPETEANKNINKSAKKDRRIYTLSSEKPAKAVLQLGLPLIAGMMVMVLYNLVDTFFIGLLRDDYQLAAVNLSYPVMMITIAISNMTGSGAGSLIARCIGAGNMGKASRTLAAGFLLTVINSIIVASAGLIFLSPLVKGLGAQSNTASYTSQYVSVILIGSLFTMGNYTFGQLLRSEGSVRYSIAGMILGTIVNIILDPIFIFVLNMQIRGAAIATILGNASGMLISLWFYISGKTILRPALKPSPERNIKLNSSEEYHDGRGDANHGDVNANSRTDDSMLSIIKEIFIVGVPASLETLLTSAAYIVNNNLAVGYGELTVAAMGISQKILSFGSYIYQGFAAGTQPLMGYNYGAGNYRRMLAVLKSGVLIVSGIELCVMLVYGTAAPMLIGIFSDSGEVIQTGCRILRANMWILPFVGATSMSRMSFQAMGMPQYSFGITLTRQLFLYVPLLLILNTICGFTGLIWAQPVTEMIMMAVSTGLLGSILRRKSGQ